MSTAGQGGGQESTAIAAMSTFAHHGIIYVPLGYKNTFAQMSSVEVVRGGLSSVISLSARCSERISLKVALGDPELSRLAMDPGSRLHLNLRLQRFKAGVSMKPSPRSSLLKVKWVGAWRINRVE